MSWNAGPGLRRYENSGDLTTRVESEHGAESLYPTTPDWNAMMRQKTTLDPPPPPTFANNAIVREKSRRAEA